MQLQRAFIFFITSLIVLSSCSEASSSVRVENHSSKRVTGLSRAEIPYDFIPVNIKVLSVGDSLTKGVGGNSKLGGYIPYLKTQLEAEKGVKEVQFTNFGVRGHKSNDLLKRLHTNPLRNAIDESNMVIITIGGNDIMKVVKENISGLDSSDFIQAKKQYGENLSNIIKSIRSENKEIPIVFIGLYNPFYSWFADVEEMDIILSDWNGLAQKVVSSFRRTYFVHIDNIFKSTTENLLYKDYFHPNDKGYSLIADRIYMTVATKTLKDLSEKQYMAIKEENKN
jgi:lysophospholipase L1-like esterase